MRAVRKNVAILFLLAFILTSASLKAQEVTRQDTIKAAAKYIPIIDSSMVRTSVFGLIERGEGGVTLNQTSTVKSAFESYMHSQSSKKKSGYKILVYSSNAQQARGISDGIAKSLKSSYPHVKIYREYKAPYFTVHIGDFRNRSDCMKIYHELSERYRQAKIVKSSSIDWYVF